MLKKSYPPAPQFHRFPTFTGVSEYPSERKVWSPSIWRLNGRYVLKKVLPTYVKRVHGVLIALMQAKHQCEMFFIQRPVHNLPRSLSSVIVPTVTKTDEFTRTRTRCSISARYTWMWMLQFYWLVVADYDKWILPHSLYAWMHLNLCTV